MSSREILRIYNSVQRNTQPSYQFLSCTDLPRDPWTRPNSVSIEDGFYGDSGKGSVVDKWNSFFLSQKDRLYSLRYNGGANAGHETYVSGKPIVTHQLPMGVISEGAIAIISRGMCIHPEDLLTEVRKVSHNFGGNLPGKLLIDDKALLALDTHRALEKTYNSYTEGGRGSTGRGIAMAYSSLYERHPVFLEDLLSKKWEEKLRKHYQLYQRKISGFNADLDQISVYNMSDKERPVGTEADFIDHLGETRNRLAVYARSDIQNLLTEVWNNPAIPFTIEGAQGIGLDIYHGVYPDVTASRPASRHILDATYTVILPEEIACRLAVIKTTYMSSVGQRKLPTVHDKSREEWIQKDFAETGRSTGRLRDIYPISIPIAQYYKRAAGYDYLAATHLDASQKNATIAVITHYTDQKGQESPYSPYQNKLDELIPHFVEFPGWDGEAIKQAKTLADIPEEAIKYLLFLSQTIAPVAMITYGPESDQYTFNLDLTKITRNL